MSKIAQITVNAVWTHDTARQPPKMIGSIAQGDTLNLVLRWLTPDKKRTVNLSGDVQVFGHAAPRRSATPDNTVEMEGSVENAAAGKTLVSGKPYDLTPGANEVQVRVLRDGEAVTFSGIVDVTRSLMQQGG